jgi:hypothetical protein
MLEKTEETINTRKFRDTGNIWHKTQKRIQATQITKNMSNTDPAQSKTTSELRCARK